MSFAILFEPHQDDAVLFAAYTCCRVQPRVITVLASDVQFKRGTGITNDQRVRENREALSILGCENEQWDIPDSHPNWKEVERRMRDREMPEVVFAPEPEWGAHDHHVKIGQLATVIFGDRVEFYSTYRRGYGRSTHGREVIPEPQWITAKHRALACYTSQIAEPTTQPWFVDTLREYAP